MSISPYSATLLCACAAVGAMAAVQAATSAPAIPLVRRARRVDEVVRPRVRARAGWSDWNALCVLVVGPVRSRQARRRQTDGSSAHY
ncbi:hypothetical protein [Burkholderia multivorans]|uniref:hypothetical protein n=1 Tax=Burkholderia multivorans TaxID=87883 RepID=UPI00207CCD8B|nr:hypothetical protein [Burkholderia multivorans]MCO1449535.1 hypothetical protein [Burkholderia multivorans]